MQVVVVSVFTADDKEQTAFWAQMAWRHITFSCDLDRFYKLRPGLVLQWKTPKVYPPESTWGFHSKTKPHWGKQILTTNRFCLALSIFKGDCLETEGIEHSYLRNIMEVKCYWWMKPEATTLDMTQASFNRLHSSHEKGLRVRHMGRLTLSSFPQPQQKLPPAKLLLNSGKKPPIGATIPECLCVAFCMFVCF